MAHRTEQVDEVELGDGLDVEPRTGVDYYACPTCGQAVDRRHLDEVLHHCQDGHRPLVIH